MNHIGAVFDSPIYGKIYKQRQLEYTAMALKKRLLQWPSYNGQLGADPGRFPSKRELTVIFTIIRNMR